MEWNGMRGANKKYCILFFISKQCQNTRVCGVIPEPDSGRRLRRRSRRSCIV